VWPALIVLAGSIALGAAALGVLDLIARRSHDHHVLSAGVAVLVLGGIGLGIVLLSPLPISAQLRGARSRRHPDPLVTVPLATPGLVAIAFAVPALVFMVAQIASGGGADGWRQAKPLGPMENVVSVALGDRATLAATADGRLWTWGEAVPAMLGASTSTPCAVPGPSDWVAVAAGDRFYLALEKNGALWGWGDNQSGALGLGVSDGSGGPTRIGDARWATVACGDDFTVAIQKNGTLWACGAKGDSQFGSGGVSYGDILRQIGTSHDWAAVA